MSESGYSIHHPSKRMRDVAKAAGVRNIDIVAAMAVLISRAMDRLAGVARDPMTPGELAEFLKIPEPACARILSAMADDGIFARIDEIAEQNEKSVCKDGAPHWGRITESDKNQTRH